MEQDFGRWLIAALIVTGALSVFELVSAPFASLLALIILLAIAFRNSAAIGRLFGNQTPVRDQYYRH